MPLARVSNISRSVNRNETFKQNIFGTFVFAREAASTKVANCEEVKNEKRTSTSAASAINVCALCRFIIDFDRWQ